MLPCTPVGRRGPAVCVRGVGALVDTDRAGVRGGRRMGGRASVFGTAPSFPREAPPAWIRVASPRPAAAGGSPPRPGTSRGLRAPAQPPGDTGAGKWSLLPLALAGGARNPAGSVPALVTATFCGAIGT